MEAAGQALSIAGRTGSRLLEGDAHLVLSAIDNCRGHHAEAIHHATTALSLHRDAGYRLGLARALTAYGSALSAAGDMDDRAEAAWHEALMVFHEVGAPEFEEVRALLRQTESEQLSSRIRSTSRRAAERS
jgi:hypothetical protein